MKSARLWSYSAQHFPAFGLNAERYGVSLRIQSECGKMLTRITPNTDTFYAVILFRFATLAQQNIVKRSLTNTTSSFTSEKQTVFDEER